MASSFLWHTQEANFVAHELKTDLEQGLGNKEAVSRLAAYGPNKLPETERIPWPDILLRQQISLMIPILILASVILVLVKQTGDMLYGVLSSAAVIIGILIANIILSGFQEIKSERLLRYIRKLANGSMYAKVLRNSHINLAKAADLVPGDIICFETGDQIAADGRLIEAKQLIINESNITGTTEPIEKDAAVLSEDIPVHLRKNMVFMGTMVTTGSGRAIVTATGAQTQVAQMSTGQGRGTLKNKLAVFSILETKLSGKGLWVAGGCIIFTAILWAAVVALLDITLVEGVLISLSFLVAMWPMGLIEAVKMALTVGMKRLTNRQTVIRRFSGAEALASATVICSSKTGVMTQNRMTVKKVFVDGHIIDVEGDGYNPELGGFPPNIEEDNPDLSLLLTVAAMCTKAEIKDTPEGWSLTGDPTEGALIVAAMKGGVNKDELGLSLTKIAELPFNPERKRMSIIFRAPKNELFVFTKGSLETVLDMCSNIQLHGYVDNLDVGRRRAIWAVNQSLARDRMQSLAFAYCQLKGEPGNYDAETVERNLVFIGVMGVVDPPRTDTKLAIKKCLDGAVMPIMLTNDYLDTAFVFARDMEIVRDGSEILAGEELDILGEKEYSGLAERFSVYADILPDHKLRIVRTLKEKGEITAVIGGHASDAVVIREADIGIATGRTGSPVTIDAADIVLMDDSFATAVDAIEGMRGAYGNAKKIIRYFFSGSIATAGTILISLIIRAFWGDFPFPPLSFSHVLWVNLLAVSIPALAIAYNPVTSGVMKDGPYPRGSIFGGGLKSKIPIRGALTTFLALIAFTFSLGPLASWKINQGRAMTAALTVLIMSQLAFAFQCRRTPDEGFFRKFLTNKLLLGITFLIIMLHLSAIYTPTLSQILGMESLSLVDWIPILVAFIICSFPLDELFVTHVEDEKRGETTEESTPVDSDEAA